MTPIPVVVSIVMLVLAASGEAPRILYGLLPFVVSGSAVYMALKAHERDLEPWAWTMVGIVIAFNPFVPLPLPRALLQLVHLLAAAAFGAGLWRLKRG